jgi:hypothetical protein
VQPLTQCSACGRQSVFGRSRSWRMLGFCLSEYCDFIQQGIRPAMFVWRITCVEIYWGRMNSMRCQAFSLSLVRKIRHNSPFLYHRLLLMLHCFIFWEFDWIVIHKCISQIHVIWTIHESCHFTHKWKIFAWTHVHENIGP